MKSATENKLFWIRTSEVDACMCREGDVFQCKKDNSSCILMNLTPVSTKENYLTNIYSKKAAVSA